MCLVLFATKAIMVLTRDFVTSLSVFSASVRPWVNINLNFGCLSLLYTILKQNLSYFAYSRHVLKLDAYSINTNLTAWPYTTTVQGQHSVRNMQLNIWRLHLSAAASLTDSRVCIIVGKSAWPLFTWIENLNTGVYTLSEQCTNLCCSGMELYRVRIWKLSISGINKISCSSSRIN